MRNYLLTSKALTVFMDGTPVTITKDDRRFDAALDALRSENWDSLIDILHPANKIQSFVSTSNRVTLERGVLKLDGKAIPDSNYAVHMILEHADQGLSPIPLMNFFEKLSANPSYRVRQDLLQFLEAGELPITRTGSFLAYKRVGENYMDLHSGTIRYRIGDKPSMPRHQVDDDPNNTCSAGLHVCSWEYLPKFGAGCGNKVMVCMINPADVVSIPTDYNNTKMRVCKLIVVDETEMPKQANIWNTSVVDTYEEYNEYDEDEEESNDNPYSSW